MSFLDSIFRVFMFVLPFALCIAGYLWVGKKAMRLPNKAPKAFAFLFLIGGLGFTLYRLVRTIGNIMTQENFEFVILIVTVFVLFFTSIALALGEPEKK